MSENPDHPMINFIPPDQEKTLRRRTIILAVVFTVSVAILAAIGAHASYRAATRGTTVLVEIERLPVIADIGRLLGGTIDAATTPADDHRLNFLILGIGGEGHDGSLLTDTIILATLDLNDKKIGLLSIPRDLAYPLGEGQFEKINAVHAYAEQDHPGEGAKRTADAIGTLLDVRIDHVVRIDFRGFASMIDALGGVDVNVERSFADPEYPIDELGHLTTLSFKKGLQHMNGQTALTFTRSRHGTNGEGSDFARSRRQQLVLMAMRDKLLSLGTLTDAKKLAALYTVVTNHLQTDLSPWDVLRLAPLASEFSRDNINLRVLSDAPDGELVAANVNGAFMLFPKKPDWSEIRDLAKNPFVTKQEQVAETKPAEPIKLEVQNGTLRTGFAAQIAAKLEKDGYEISAFGNARHRTYEQSVIFDLTGGKKPTELARLRRALNAVVSLTNVSTTSSRSLIPEQPLSAQVDFLLILGEASYSLVTSNQSP